LFAIVSQPVAAQTSAASSEMIGQRSTNFCEVSGFVRLAVELDGENYYSIWCYPKRTDDSANSRQEEVRDNTSDTEDVSTYIS